MNLDGSSNQDGRGTGRRGFGPRREDDDYDRPSESDNNWRAGAAAPLPERRQEGGERSRGFGDSSHRNNEDDKRATRSDGADRHGWRSGAQPRGDDDCRRRGFDDGPGAASTTAPGAASTTAPIEATTKARDAATTKAPDAATMIFLAMKGKNGLNFSCNLAPKPRRR